MNILLFILLLEGQVRELWFRPFGYDLLIYTLNNYHDLFSGMELFLYSISGWGMIFRDILLVTMFIHFSALAIFYYLTTKINRFKKNNFKITLSKMTLVVVPLILSLIGGNERYKIGQNFIVHPFLSFNDNEIIYDNIQFDQIPKASSVKKDDLRHILNDVKPFKNLIILFYESARWNNFQTESLLSESPNFKKLALSGLFSKCFVPLPHTSKAYYSVLTGRYPFPDIEMRESQRLHSDSFIHSLKKKNEDMKSYVFTSMHLGFENTSGLLNSVGFDNLFELNDLLKIYGGSHEEESSFGGGDLKLYNLGIKYISELKGPFIAAFLPLVAHYPYDYPNKPDDQRANYEAYKKSLNYSDQYLGMFTHLLDENNLLEDTLLVIVGDHGESFGEHGTYAHNCSIHIEETTVPLIFWSKNNELYHDEIILSRQLDIAPTIMDLLGYPNDETPVQGYSILRQKEIKPLYMTAYFKDSKLGLLEYPLKYMFEPSTGILVSYNLNDDPEELKPIVIENELKEKIVNRLMNFKRYQYQAFPR